MTDYKTIQTDLDAAVRSLMASVLITPEEPQSAVNTHQFVQAVMQVARVAEWAAGLHESYATARQGEDRISNLREVEITVGDLSPEEIEALRSAPGSGVLIPGEPNLAHMKRLMREVAHYFTPGYRLCNSMPSTHSGAVYDLLAEAEKHGWLERPRPV
jgi:hypothetical protein